MPSREQKADKYAERIRRMAESPEKKTFPPATGEKKKGGGPQTKGYGLPKSETPIINRNGNNRIIHPRRTARCRKTYHRPQGAAEDHKGYLDFLWNYDSPVPSHNQLQDSQCHP